jgi:hypothetical protein
MFNIYCDESCHLPNDKIDVMVLGAISCPTDKKEKIYSDIRRIKEKYGIKPELKWTKVSSPTLPLYEELIDYFFMNEDLVFRGIVAKDKHALDHATYNNNDHDLWYYKMYYYLLDWFCHPNNEYRIFIDIKDTNGGPRIKKLHEVLCNNKYDYMQDIIKDISQVNSERSDMLQLTDIFTGVLSYLHRGLDSSELKMRLIKKVEQYVGTDLSTGTLPSEDRFNVFIWRPKRGFR